MAEAKEQGADPDVLDYRARISAEDRAILAAVNRRVALVAELHAYKVEQGYPLVDEAREEALLSELERANGGPLSSTGVRDLFSTVLSVSKRDAGRREVTPRTGGLSENPGASGPSR